MKRITTKVAVLMMAALAVSGCSILKRGTPKTPVLGTRVAVLTTENDVSVDPATRAIPMALPAPVVNPEWGQSGGNASKSMGHLALGRDLASAFSVSVRRRRRLRQRPHLREQRPRLRRRARPAQRRYRLAGPPRWPAARRSDR